jgi:hypothetical protein
LQQGHSRGDGLSKSHVLRLLLNYSPLLTPIATCLPATLVAQVFAPNDVITSYLFIAYWIAPPLLVTLVRFSSWVLSDESKDRFQLSASTVDSTSYLCFLASYIGLLLALLLRVVAVNSWEEYLQSAINSPVTWLGIVSSILLTYVLVFFFQCHQHGGTCTLWLDDRFFFFNSLTGMLRSQICWAK